MLARIEGLEQVSSEPRSGCSEILDRLEEEQRRRTEECATILARLDQEQRFRVTESERLLSHVHEELSRATAASEQERAHQAAATASLLSRVEALEEQLEVATVDFEEPGFGTADFDVDSLNTTMVDACVERDGEAPSCGTLPCRLGENEPVPGCTTQQTLVSSEGFLVHCKSDHDFECLTAHTASCSTAFLRNES